jgi:CO/xanthine dehydrogenase FAD-binding subunit
VTRVAEYIRPTSMRKALEFLRGNESAVVIGGGTRLSAFGGSRPLTVIDLQALSLAGIESHGASARIGATTTLQQMVEDERLPPVVREAARRERPATLRSMATIGGCVATGDWESELVATLLVHDAEVHVMATLHETWFPLDKFLGFRPPRTIITDVVIATDGKAAADRVGRTGADRPIVAAVARCTDTGVRRLAISGVGTVPLLVNGFDPVVGLIPPGDFRGSSEYRRQLAVILSTRVLAEVE